MHDVVVVGAGPAGLCAAEELSRTHDCLLLDMGRDHHARDRHAPHDILAGIGGAGLFSDGKHSFHPSASALWTLPDPDALALAFTRTADLLARHGVAATAYDRTPQPDLAPGAWHHKHYPSIYMSLPERSAVIAELAAACPQRWSDTEVLAATRTANHLRLTVRRHDTLDDISTRALVIATGRLSPRWIRPWLEPLTAPFVFRRLEFGLRIESFNSSPLFTRLAGTDPKLRFRESDTLEARTFCVCRDGEVLLGSASNISAWSGRADVDPTDRSNLGLLVRTSDPRLARAIEPFLFSAPPLSLPLQNLDPAALHPQFGPAGTEKILHALAHLHAFCPELEGDPAATLHTPCIEGVGDYPDDDGALRLAPDIWTAGDVCGRFRGIVASMISGRYVATRVTAALTTGSSGSRPRR